MAFRTLGNSGKLLTVFSYLILLYSLVAAYVSAGGSLLSELLQLMHIHLPVVMGCLIFVLILGGVVFKGINAVDYLNRFFFSLKGILLVLVIALAVPKIEWTNLALAAHSSKYLLAAAPIFLCAFGYHILIPVLSEYLNYEKKQIQLVFFFGSFFTWLLYILWLAVTMGIIPLDGFFQLARQKGSVGEFVSLFSDFVNSKWLESAIHGFANITVVTCFLGVSLGLFDFLADLLKKPKNFLGKLQITFFTFIPPIVFAIFYPKGFILALGNAAICVAFSHVMLPAWMVFQLRKKKIKSSYRVSGGHFLLGIVFWVGLLLIVLQLMADISLLPILGK